MYEYDLKKYLYSKTLRNKLACIRKYAIDVIPYGRGGFHYRVLDEIGEILGFSA